nr:reverse transcriptase family protein [Planctomycetota bacterium]
MGLLRWLLGLFGANSGTAVAKAWTDQALRSTAGRPWRRPRLSSIRRNAVSPPLRRTPAPTTPQPAYRFARQGVAGMLESLRGRSSYLNLATDLDRTRLDRWNLPPLATPDELADWLEIPVGKLAWLSGRLVSGNRPPSTREAHYVFRWKAKRSGGARLIESPKPLLRQVQTKILREILDKVPPHAAAHGFVAGRSILTNAKPHCDRVVVVKWDLTDFYASVRYSRVVAIFRSLGFSREVALWLASLTTSAIAADLPFPESGPQALRPYLGRHLPQGAATSPALANLSAFSLDVRLSGLARAFGGAYTRYADDLTISGDDAFARQLKNVIPLVEKVIRQERFHVHAKKRKVIRRG